MYNSQVGVSGVVESLAKECCGIVVTLLIAAAPDLALILYNANYISNYPSIQIMYAYAINV